MNSNNYIQIAGRLTADVTPNESNSFARLTVAMNFGKDDKKEALFLNGVIYAKEFEKNKQTIPWDLLKKGQQIFLTGRLQPNNWTDKDGKEHKDMHIVINKIRDKEIDE